MRNNIGDDEGLPGEITSGIYSKDEGIPDINGNAQDEDDDEEELPSNPLQGRKSVRPGNDDAGEEEERGGGLDLFGDEDDAEDEARKPAYVGRLHAARGANADTKQGETARR